MMTLERFAYLADAYGADLRRWPVAERELARVLVDQDDRARAIVAATDELDVLLDSVARPVVSAALREQVLASAAGAGLRASRRWGRHRDWTTLAWLSGAGWMAAAFAGVVFGVSLSWNLTEEHRADAVLYQASLDGADDTEVLDG